MTILPEAADEYGVIRTGPKFKIVDGGGPAAYDKPRKGKSKSTYHDGTGDREPEDRSRQYEVCAYKYQFEDGAHAFDVVRLADPKSFRFRSPDGRPSIEGIRRVPYRLPELLAGVAAGETVYITEGERDADAVAALGLVATTNPGGAPKTADGMASRWLPYFNKAFTGARVVIVPDSDEPGRIRARYIAAQLRGKAERVTVVELPGAKDVSEWLGNGGTVEELVKLGRGIQATPFPILDPRKIPPREWLYGFHYCRQFVSATIAPGGMGKTSLVLAEVVAMATGRELLGIKPHGRSRCWYWSGEEPVEELWRRVYAILKHHGIAAEELADWLWLDSGLDTPIKIATESYRDGVKVALPVSNAVLDQIRENGIDVLALDPFITTHSVTENLSGHVEAVVDTWKSIAMRARCSIDLSHHTRKGQSGGGEYTAEDARGSSTLVNAVRDARVLNRMSADEWKAAGVEDSRLRFFKIGDGKANMAPPAEKAAWYRLESVDLGNDTDERRADSIGVVTRWEWPDATAEVSPALLFKIQERLNREDWRDSVQATAWAGNVVAQALGLDIEQARDSIKTMIKQWKTAGLLKVVMVKDEHREDRPCLKVGRWAEIRQEEMVL